MKRLPAKDATLEGLIKSLADKNRQGDISARLHQTQNSFVLLPAEIGYALQRTD